MRVGSSSPSDKGEEPYYAGRNWCRGAPIYISESLAREIGLLRTLAQHLERRPLPFERLTQELMRQEGLGHVHEKASGIICIRIPGHHAFTDLTDCLFDRLPAMERGAIYADIQDELFNFIEDYVGREPSAVGSQDAKALVGHFEKWFADKTSSRRGDHPARTGAFGPDAGVVEIRS